MTNPKSLFVFSCLTTLFLTPLLVVNVNAQNKPTKAQCVESLNLTAPQKQQLLQIKNETANKKEKLEQFIAELSPQQTQQLKACLKASQ